METDPRSKEYLISQKGKIAYSRALRKSRTIGRVRLKARVITRVLERSGRAITDEEATEWLTHVFVPRIVMPHPTYMEMVIGKFLARYNCKLGPCKAYLHAEKV